MKTLFLAAALFAASSARADMAVTWTAAADLPSPTATVTVVPVPNVTPDMDVHPPAMYAGWYHINLAEAERLHSSSKNLFVDARATAEYDQAHIPRAVSIPLGEFEDKFKKNLTKIKRAKVIVVYCHGGGCSLSEKETEQFHKHGYKNAICFHGG